MPDFTLSDALREAYASAPAQEVVLHTLELRHSSFAEPLRVVCDESSLEAVLEDSAPENAGETVTFLPLSFSFRLPDVVKSTSPEIEIALDNATGEIAGYLDDAANSGSLIEVIYRPYIASDTSVPQMDPPLSLVVRSVSASVFRATARAGYADLGNLKFPSATYDTERFAGLSA